MVQAIVFLPLLGAILAGLISIVGAHARNPSGDTVEHHAEADDHGASSHATMAITAMPRSRQPPDRARRS